mmetsp:Transcript_6827/g.9443  ORF Transcript_6827/g.9443 Transcript_6827/m.9443 type:complete len:542 (-) Transcript_6827:63-1688(-)
MNLDGTEIAISLPLGASGKITNWMVNPGEAVYENQSLFEFRLDDYSAPLEENVIYAPENGYVKTFLAKTYEDVPARTPVLLFVRCSHAVVFHEMCSICGKTIKDIPNNSIIKIHPKIAVSKKEGERISEETTKRLKSSKKLSLVLDLDNTVIHATTEELIAAKKPLTESQLKANDIIVFKLPPNPINYYIKLRPKLAEFLNSVCEMYELHIYTMGTKQYASKVAELMNSKIPMTLFHEHRIMSRDESITMNFKNLQQIFPCDDTMVVIIDDREDVWFNPVSGKVSENLLKIDPYHFFDTMKEVNEVAGKPNPNPVPKTSLVQSTDSEPSQTDDLIPLEEDEDIVLPIPDLDRSLDNFARILKEIHTRFYESHSHDTKQIISSMKNSVLDGCVIVFSALFPTNIPPESSDVWRLATAFGAECRSEIDSEVTHVVAARQTPKVLQALQTPGLFLVTADWLHRSCERWERVDEMEFPLSPHPVLMKDSEPPILIPKAKRKVRDQQISDNNNGQPSKKSKPSEDVEEDEDDDLIGMIEGELENDE